MKKIFTLLMTAFVALCAQAQSETFVFGEHEDFASWTSSYSARVLEYENATVSFASANKQTSTITDCPVTKGGAVTVTLKDETKKIKGLKFTCKQWTTKSQEITLHVSSDGGETFEATQETSSNFMLNAFVPEGTNAVKFTFSSSSNQVGIVSLELQYSSGDDPTDPVAVDGVSLTDGNGNAVGTYTMLTVTETMQLKAVVTPSNATNKKVTWEVMQNDDVIAFENGKVTALKAGQAAVVATTEDGEYQAATTFIVADIADATIDEFIEAEGKTCYLTGVVSEITNTTYGNFTLTDESGSIIVYGCLNADGESKKFEELGVSEGDKIKVLAKEYKMYTPKEGDPYPEAVNVIFVENLGPVTPPSEYTFEIETDGINFTVTPSDEEVTYYVEVIEAGFDEETVEAYFDATFEEMGAGLDYFDGVSTQSFKGDWYCDPGDEVEIWVCAVSADYKRISKVFHKAATVADPTGITNIVNDKKNAVTFNLAGQKVGANAKGIVIKNGKKVMVK